MKNKLSFYVLISFISCLLIDSIGFAAEQKSSELSPRQGMSPLERAKIHSIQAQQWSKIGKFESDTETTSTTYGSGIGSKNCTTNIGTTTAKSGVSSGRYGPSKNSDNIVVVKGDVISLCK